VTVLSGTKASLETLCSGLRGAIDGRIRIASGGKGIERLEARLYGQAYSPHRHDTYAIGITLSGVQSFHFRGELWHCLPGQCHILHPDETHDGGAGTEEGFSYRILYIDPWLVRQALPGKTLPFVGHPVVEAVGLPTSGATDIWNMDSELDDLAQIELVVAVTELLISAAGAPAIQLGRLPLRRLSRVRDLIAERPEERRSMAELERLSGLDRWTLARQFRAVFGTSPSRFRTLRQLDHVRRLLKRGTPLAEASIAAGFSDQSHMSRHFKNAYGFTPGRWNSCTELRESNTWKKPAQPSSQYRKGRSRGVRAQ
jgi:AraC-like DNA-binding protein